MNKSEVLKIISSNKILFIHFNIIILGLVMLVEPLKKTCTTKVKANSVKQEYEKQDELKRSAMRAVTALLAIPTAGKCKILLIYSFIVCPSLFIFNILGRNTRV
jgi:hypothetical protein